MSEDSNAADTSTSCCASCGIAEIDDVKLKDCDYCDIVRYCSDECMEEHKSEHKDACEQRAAELRDELLFKQPESSHWGDCPICCLPFPVNMDKSTTTTCCSKKFCAGCMYTNQKRELEMRSDNLCPFCRELAPSTVAERDKQRMKRVEANDPDALCQEGVKQSEKEHYFKAVEYFTKAAELDNVEAHFRLGCLHLLTDAEGVEQNVWKGMYHLEVAAIGGHAGARYLLGVVEWSSNNHERAVKHYIIAATQGQDDAIKKLTEAFKSGFVEKENLDAALRAHKAAVDATKSPQREFAEKIEQFKQIKKEAGK